MFRRRAKRDVADPAGTDLPGGLGGEPAELPVDDPAESAGRPTEGPWDVADAPEDGVARLDLGGLRVPAPADIELRLEADPAGNVAGVLLVRGASTLVIGAFAAPRQQGIWDDVRAELLDTLRAEGGAGKEREGPFGAELAATVAGPEGRQAARFVGIDGPCWFVRGMFTGPAATDPAQARHLEQALRDVIVSRGDGALPVRGPLPLVLPTDVIAQATHDAAVGPPELPVRGPEITEIR